MYEVCEGARRSKSIRSSGARVTDSYEPPDMVLKTELESSGISASALSRSLIYLSSPDLNISFENPVSYI